MALDSSVFEKLGTFYLGRALEGDDARPSETPLLYDSRDLVTHAVCMGMTGSGKTGLCLALLEEAAMDGVPAIIIDPKGDLANLLLTFPDLKSEDFRPWINEEDAARKGLTPEIYAEQQADMWRQGLAKWGQDGERIRTLREKADFAIYTPGSRAGLSVNLLDVFHAPPDVQDSEAMAERAQTATAALLGLIASTADAGKSREGSLLGAIFAHEWQAGNDLDLVTLIAKIQNPPFEKIGILDLESFYPAKERFALVLSLNTLLASPGFAAWGEGERLSIPQFLHTATGRPRHTIFSIAHLDDSQRMFFVTLLLNEIVSWMRQQSGTTSLRAIVYMDEIFGYFPPVANPPSKLPLLTLLKQARAYGVGIVLATQNPVDLDYKGLANAGTWFVGRLQTERDKARVIEGLLGASANLTRPALEVLISQLGARKFLMNNVHDDGPVLMESRWAMSYLRGPLTRDQIRFLMQSRKPPAVLPTSKPPTASKLPTIPPGIKQVFLPSSGTLQPRLVGVARVKFFDVKSRVDTTRVVQIAALLPEGVSGVDFTGGERLDVMLSDFSTTPPPDAVCSALPASGTQSKQYPLWEKDFSRWVADNERMEIFACPDLKLTSQTDETRGDFQARAAHAQRELRDEKIEAIRKKYAPKLAALQARLVRAEAAIQRQENQARQAGLQTAISFGSTLLGAFLGRKAFSATTLTRAGSAARSVGRTFQEGSDVGAAKESAASVIAEQSRVNGDFQAESAALVASLAEPQIEIISLKPARAGISVELFALGWV